MCVYACVLVCLRACMCVLFIDIGLVKLKPRNKRWDKVTSQIRSIYVRTRNAFSIHYGVSNAWEFVVRMRGRM